MNELNDSKQNDINIVDPYKMMRVRFWMLCTLAAISLFFAGCDKESTPDPGPPVTPVEVGKAQVWLTTGDQSKLLSREGDVSITEAASTTLPLITIEASQKLQEIEGFGAALTGSSAYLINKVMTSGQRQSLVKDLFDPVTGIGINYLRVTIGASDFSLSDYTYNDMPAGETDYTLENFSIAKDQEDVVPVLKSIVTVAPSLKIMGTPWSAPAWMKTNGSLKGGKLKAEAYDVYSEYFVKYIEAMKNEGVTIDAITVQNEPLYFTANYPCMEMTAEEQRTFIRDHLGPLFQAEGVNTKIILYDHNWDNPNYVISILNDTEAKKYVAGSAFHAYAGNVSAMTTVHNAHADKGVYFTEISGGEWATNFSDNLQWNMSNIFIGTTKNWSKTALLWNLALDQNHGPTNNGCQDCRGVVTINSTTGSVTRNVEYYSIGHFSKFIRYGAYRVSSSISAPVAGLDHVSFINADGKKVAVVANNDNAAKSFTIKDGEKQFNYSLAGKAVVTLVWE